MRLVALALAVVVIALAAAAVWPPHWAPAAWRRRTRWLRHRVRRKYYR